MCESRAVLLRIAADGTTVLGYADAPMLYKTFIADTAFGTQAVSCDEDSGAENGEGKG